MDDSRGDVHLHVAVGGDVDGVRPVVAGRLGAHRVARRLEHVQAVVARQDVVEHQPHLVLLDEGVEGAGLEALEGGVSGGEDGEGVGQVVELLVDLDVYLGFAEEVDEGVVVGAVDEDGGDVERLGCRLRGGRLGSVEGGGEGEQCG